MARIHEVKGVVTKSINRNIHRPAPGRIQAMRAVTIMKRRAHDTKERTASVEAQGVAGVSEASQGSLPSVPALKQRVRRVRRTVNKAPPCPTSRTDLIVPVFEQFFVFFGERFDWAHPLLYALLPNKTRATYHTMFEAVANLGVQNRQFLFSCDFELAVIKEFRNEFPAATIGGCLFHFSQNIQKHVRQLHLKALYENDSTINLHVRMLVALASVPVDDVVQAFEALQEYVDSRLQPLVEYIETIT